MERLNEGRFGVKLSFCQDAASLGPSRDITTKCFLQLEKKHNKDLCSRYEYQRLMSKYQELGHMAEINLDQLEIDSKSHCFLPRQCVLKPESTSTKLRVALDASFKTSSGYDLNDVL